MTLMEVGQRFSIHLVRVIPYKKTSVFMLLRLLQLIFELHFIKGLHDGLCFNFQPYALPSFFLVQKLYRSIFKPSSPFIYLPCRIFQGVVDAT